MSAYGHPTTHTLARVQPRVYAQVLDHTEVREARGRRVPAADEVGHAATSAIADGSTRRPSPTALVVGIAARHA